MKLYLIFRSLMKISRKNVYLHKSLFIQGMEDTVIVYSFRGYILLLNY